MKQVSRHVLEVGGRRISYLTAGPRDGTPLVLVHGLLSDATTWERLLPGLGALGFRVVAPDLLGHGESDKPADATYDVTGLATLLLRVMDELDITTATLVGHSLGGGIAIAMSYLEPDRVERFVLVASGGFGTDLHAVLRHAGRPTARRLVRFAVSPTAGRVLGHPGLARSLRLSPDTVHNLGRMARTLRDPQGSAAFYATLSQMIDRGGQRGSMVEMGYVDPAVPTLIIWCERDPIIPVTHALRAQRHFDASRLELFPGTSHEPHRQHPERFVATLGAFLRPRPRSQNAAVGDGL